MLKKLYVIFFVTLLFSGMQLISPNSSEAACRCVCVDGKKQNVCSSKADLRRSCIGLCPLSSKSSKSNSPGLKPIGTKKCKMSKVWNSKKTYYKWEKLCN